MPTREPPSQRIARQLAALMKRHGLKNASRFEALMHEAHFEPLISQVTIRAILGAKARTQPEPTTLRRLAEFLGETYLQAFPEPEDEAAPVIDVGGRRIAFRAEDGRPLTPALAEQIRAALGALTADHAHDIHETKKHLRKR